ncbi:hypothetical protein [Microvirga flavescens]|uniref:hypothetical protein n=1 Tax=Microvirga flavescens TaxID=2249811 RepID=UPI000DD9D2A2|nr:hypothetical protein [Microvirga flavescens]
MRTRAERVAAVIMGLCGVAAIVAFASSIASIGHFEPDRALPEAWRSLGFLVFAGLFLLLAVYPRRVPGLWELAFLHKAGMVIVATFVVGLSHAQAQAVALVDGILAVLIFVSYMLARGYEAWRARV